MNVSERARLGKDARRRVSRSSHGDWAPPTGRADPLEVLRRQEAGRVPALVPIRYGRMAASPTAFMCGSAAVMAADLAARPHTALTVQLCGDAHLLNFALYASPDGTPVFDIGDFDETYPGPFEWDVERLAASVAVAALHNGHDPAQARRAARASALAYRLTMRHLADLGELAVRYGRIDPADVLPLLRSPGKDRHAGRRAPGPRRPDRPAVVEGEDGMPRIAEEPPLVVHTGRDSAGSNGTVSNGTGCDPRRVFDDYRTSLPDEHRVLLDRFTFADAAREVTGIGGADRRRHVVLLTGRDGGDRLLLRATEAGLSVLQAHLPARGPEHHGHRVVTGRRLTQAACEVFLGWTSGPGERQWHWHRRRDPRGRADVARMSPARLRDYAAVCGRALARAHARSGDRIAIAAYLGGADTFDRAVAEFAMTYASVTEADHRRLVNAVDEGVVAALMGV